MRPSQRNKFCALPSLRNESDVEQFFVAPLLKELGFEPEHIQTKTVVKPQEIDKGRRRRMYIPDYIAHLTAAQNSPVLVIDAKHPDEDASNGVEDAQLYASIIRRGLREPRPEQYCIGINGRICLVKQFDSNQVLHHLTFSDFVDGNPKFETLKRELARSVLAAKGSVRTSKDKFLFRKVAPSELPSIFEMCHRKIWKGEKRSPASAFYEFSKLMYVKIDEDRRVRERLSETTLTSELSHQTVPYTSVHFASHWISEMEDDGTENPINSILFGNLVNRLEEQITRGEKKRIFDQGEGIDLTPSTIKEVVKLLEHLDLGAVDEDLNGRMFETFLTATMRGKALGQFFTPRSVVKFMVQLADLQASRSRIDTVLDGCCGTGGFLIEAMAEMSARIIGNSSLSQTERGHLVHHLRTEALWGIDAGTDPRIARIARLNMLLHRDGGSRIYQGDSLDKELQIESGMPLATRLEMEELRIALLGDDPQLFSVILTNPPFSMNYERKHPSEEKILAKYVLATENGKPRASLRSSVMFLERYWELLSAQGRLMTVMDDSVLNTMSNQAVREFIRERFIIKAVIGLPKNTFVKADGSVATSVLYLRRKAAPTEEQPAIYMAVCKNVGHNDAGKERPELNELPMLLCEFRHFEEYGCMPPSPSGFIVQAGEIDKNNRTGRLDAAFFNPDYFATLDRLNDVANERGWQIQSLQDLLVSGRQTALTGGATPLGARYSDSGPKFIRVQNVRPNRLEWSAESDVCIPTDVHNGELTRSQLQAGDIIFTITGTCGNAAVVPDDFGEANINQHSVRMRVEQCVIKPEYLAAFLNSSLCRPQIDRAETGSSRPALDYHSIRKLRILVPSTIGEQVAIVESTATKVRDLKRLESHLTKIESEMQDILANI